MFVKTQNLDANLNLGEIMVHLDRLGYIFG